MREAEPPHDEARRRPIAATGGVTPPAAPRREGRRLAWLRGLSLDLRLGFRMLVKYPGLTLVGGLAMAFSIWVGAFVFEMVRVTVHPTLPLPGGDRIVKIEHWDRRESKQEPRVLHDFAIWRGALRSVTDLGAYSDLSRNLVVRGAEAGPVNVAAITASAFRIAPTPPLLGRVLVERDERPEAPPVLLLGHDVWRTRFAGDPAVVGRRVQLDEGFAEVVGVMPEGFEFPVSHDLWVPLKLTAADGLPRSGAGVSVFGRLAPGASTAEAQAEVEVIGKRLARDIPETHEHLQPFVRSYATFFGDPGSSYALLRSFNVFALLLVVLLCSNVGLLLFARAATRETEIVVRSALGASRGRIVAQLFAEALAIGGVAAAVGLAAVATTLRLWGRAFFEVQGGVVPFWVDPKLSVPTILYALVLTLVAAAVAGIVPGLKVTHGLGARLKQGTAGGGLRFGGVWTAVIVAQVAVTVAVPAAIFIEQGELRRVRAYDGGFESERYAAMRLEMPSTRDGVDTTARYAAAAGALRQRLLAEPGVSGVAFASHLPRLAHPESEIELGDRSAAADEGLVSKRVDIAHVDPSYFDVLDAPVRAGRAFRAGDEADGARVVIVDQGFVDQVLRGRNALGRQLRLTPRGGAPAGEESPWFEIVGVVADLGMGAAWERQPAAGVYFPIRLDRGPLQMIVHARGGDPLALAPRIRALSTAVDPTLRLAEIQRLDQVADPLLWILRFWLRVTAAVTVVALLLSLAGIYAVLSFAVARRTREIGVRVALGASNRGVITATFRRPLAQVAGGVAVGTLLVGVLVTLLAAPPDAGLADAPVAVSALQVLMLVAYAATMFGVCMLACIVPTRRALRVQPTVALRAE
jgi:predicted permease